LKCVGSSIGAFWGPGISPLEWLKVFSSTQTLRKLVEGINMIYNPLLPIPDIEKNSDETPMILYASGGSYIKGFHIAVKILAEVLAKYRCRAYAIYGHSIRPEQVKLLEGCSQRGLMKGSESTQLTETSTFHKPWSTTPGLQH